MDWHLSLDFAKISFTSWPNEKKAIKRKLKINVGFFIK